jgi:hypothetical protein
LIYKGRPPLEVTVDDQLALWMRSEPAFPVTQELIDLGVADVVVLLVIEHGKQHVQVRQGVVYRHER